VRLGMTSTSLPAAPPGSSPSVITGRWSFSPTAVSLDSGALEPTCLPPGSGLGEPRGVRLVFRAAGFKKKKRKRELFISVKMF
jgi:hypothetical protein